MYLIIGRHSLLLLHCQDFPCKLHRQIMFQSPPDLIGQSPQKYHLCWPLGREPGCAEPGFLFTVRGPAPGLAPNHGATAHPHPTPDCLACPQVFAQHNFLWLAVFSLTEKSEVPARAQLTILGEELVLVLGSGRFSLHPAFPSVYKQSVSTQCRVHTHPKGVSNAS